MLGQSKISSFFASKPMKRSLEDEEGSSSKAIKTDNGESLSVEQRDFIEEKRLVALDKLYGTAAMGKSWKEALKREFSKEYFKKVRSTKYYM